MSQTRTASFAEAWVNIAIGFIINWTCNMVFLPLFGFDTLTAVKAFWIGCVFTGVSLVRQYILRRWFNGMKWGNR